MKPTDCIGCGKPHLLRDEDAGSDREIKRLCEPCYAWQFKTRGLSGSSTRIILRKMLENYFGIFKDKP